MRARRIAKVVLGTLAGVYVVVALGLFAAQRAMLFAAPRPAEPRIAGAELLALDDGRVHALLLRAKPGLPTVVHFHGNAEQLSDLGWLAERYAREGVGFCAVEYPGYGLSSSQPPSEDGAFHAGEVTLAELRRRGVDARDLVLEGFSLGTGVATELAARGGGARVALIAPYTRIADVASRFLPFLPVSRMLRDRFDSASKAARVKQPVLVLHGDRDGVVPFELGRRLATALPDARLVPVPGAGHVDVLDHGAAWATLLAFVKTGARP